MFIFGLYTVLIWWIAFRYRRRWLGAGAVVVGVAGMYIVSELLAVMFPTADGRGSPLIAMLLLPYEGMLFVGGMYIVALPRPKRLMTCRGCSYDMRGLDAGSRCPECGRAEAAVVGRGGRSASPQTPEDAEEQDGEGQAQEKGPSEPRASAA